MIIIKLHGGLGNQLFQFAAYCKLKEFKKDVWLDVGEYNLPWNNKYRKYLLDKFQITTDFRLCIFSNSILLRLIHAVLHTKVKVLPMTLYNTLVNSSVGVGTSLSDDMVEIKDNMYIDGYFLDARFFPKHFLEVIMFKSVYTWSKTVGKLYSDIQNCNSVSVHIRRTDYLNARDYDNYCNICTRDFYKKAISYFEDKSNSYRFYFFSDDIIWVKNEFGVNQNYVYVEHEDYNDSTVSDLFLMSSCKHNIIANSTYSWWGAYFNKNPQKIIVCPEKYQNTSQIKLFLEDWIHISS